MVTFKSCGAAEHRHLQAARTHTTQRPRFGLGCQVFLLSCQDQAAYELHRNPSSPRPGPRDSGTGANGSAAPTKRRAPSAFWLYHRIGPLCSIPRRVAHLALGRTAYMTSVWVSSEPKLAHSKQAIASRLLLLLRLPGGKKSSHRALYASRLRMTCCVGHASDG